MSGCGGVCPETAYSPAVTWSDLTYTATGPVNDVEEITMVQGGVAVSTPSTVPTLAALLADGFTTTYTGDD